MTAEADAVKEILGRRKANGYIVIGSPTLDAEILKNPNASNRDEIIARYRENVDLYANFTPTVYARARGFMLSGLKRMDSYHLALAEHAGVGTLLTVDRTFARIATSRNLCGVNVINPLTFNL